MLDWLKRARRRRTNGVASFRQSYESFRRLLGRNAELLSLMAELEADLRCEDPREPRVRERIQRILDTSLDLVQDLNELEGGKAGELFAVHQRLEEEVRKHDPDGRFSLKFVHATYPDDGEKYEQLIFDNNLF